jgi:hypothetical protein
MENFANMALSTAGFKLYGGLQTFGTAVVAIERVALKSPSNCKFGIARA